MNTKHISLAFAATAALLAGCVKSPIEEVKTSEQFTNLELAYVGATETKAAIDGTTFPTDGEIGLFLFTDEAATTPYGESGYENIEYSYNSTKEKWTADPSITVGSTSGYLYGYYPYSSTSTDIKAIPVNSSLNGDDVMYATSQTVTDKTASQASLTMNHALARVAIKVVNNGYTGEAKLSKIKLEGAEIAPSGTLNATGGSISATKSSVTLDIPTANQAITASGTTYECLLVPSKVVSDKQEVTLTLSIDGQDKFVTFSGDNGVIIAQNTKSNITITLSNSGISVQTVSVEGWNVVEVGGYKVTVKRSSEDGIADDVFLDVTSNGSTVTIKSLTALTGRWANCTCTPAGKATCSPSIDAENGICTFTITDVQEDITAEVGYLKCNASAIYDSDMGTVKLNETAVDPETPVQFFGGEEVKFLAVANSGCVFLKWTDGSGADMGTDNPFTISRMTSDTTLNAVFGYEITAAAKPTGAGTVTGAEAYPKGSTATLTATPGGIGAEFIGWAKADSPGNIITEENSYTISSVDQSASYIAVFRLTEALPGLFTVNASGKQVIFSKGNLWCCLAGTDADKDIQDWEISSWNFESNQYDSTPSEGTTQRSRNHVSHFMWCKNSVESLKLSYAETGTTSNDTFFADKDNFAVNGVSTWRTLSREEWLYLFGSNAARKDRYKYGVTVCTKKDCVVLVPDDWDLATKSLQSSYDATAWEEAQAAGAVCLPAANYRQNNNICYDWGYGYNGGYYWTGSPYNGDGAFYLHFGPHTDELWQDEILSVDYLQRFYAKSVRLVADVE